MAQSQPNVEVVRGDPNLCSKTKKSLDLEISSPGLKKCPFSSWRSHLSPSSVALGTQIGLPNTSQDPHVHTTLLVARSLGRASSAHFLHPHRVQGHGLLHICFPFIKPAFCGCDREQGQREIGTVKPGGPSETPHPLLQGVLITRLVVEKKMGPH